VDRTIKKYTASLTKDFKSRILLWAQQYDEIAWLDSNDYEQGYSSYQAMLAVDAFTAIKTDHHKAFEKLEEYQSLSNDWLFGYLSYDLKNDVELLKSNNFDGLNFLDLYFFQPKKVFLFSENEVELQYLKMVDSEMESDWMAIINTEIPVEEPTFESPIKISPRTSKDYYFKQVDEMLRHIKRGDIYEVNFCQEFFSENVTIDALKTFRHLNNISKPPFATFLKLDEHYVLSASPERYLKKEGNTVVSQPIKGTAKRLSDPSEDQKMIDQLRNDPKERSENIMITDLVRNDLSRFATKGSVVVEELCEAYSFEQVHQLISTVRCEVADDLSSVEIIKNTFPMGSMTGAPKFSAMKIIEELEVTKRGVYSGAVGYFAPGGDFDFNVIIRSILYNASAKYVSFSVGGAITAKSIPENEYEECLIKARAMREVLEG
jgi:para-aminobenzoate synthetase component I